MSDFDLRELVDAELATSPVADPHIVAEHVAKQIKANQVKAALDEALPVYVREVAHATGRRSRPASPSPEATPRKVAAYIERYRLSVGDREWKFLADCTRDDLLVAVDLRRKMAEENLAQAARLADLADQLKRHKAATVRDLPPEVVAEALQ